mmetsp:Transcript_34937/g.43123  ORF Transcript_34937/g.43123 Transcript_34937/m.43123 type:complete len:240 (-) Transcript_34937:90-809(-)
MSGSGKNKNIDDDSDDELFLEKQYKIVLLGDGNVGKTSICNRFVEDKFEISYKQTIGLDFFIRHITINDANNNRINIAMQLWDIGGNQVNSNLIPKYINNCNAIMFVYDITCLNSFDNITDWLSVVKNTFPSNNLPYMTLIGNKHDLQHKTIVSIDMHNEMCSHESLHSAFVSAKNGDGLEATFYNIAADITGIKLNKTDIDSKMKIIKANVMQHDNNDSKQQFEQIIKKTKRKECILL